MKALKLLLLLTIFTSCGNIPKLKEATDWKKSAETKESKVEDIVNEKDGSRKVASKKEEELEVEDNDAFIFEDDAQDLAALKNMKKDIKKKIVKKKATKKKIKKRKKVKYIDPSIKQKKKLGTYVPRKVGVSSLLVASQKATAETIRVLVNHKDIDANSQSKFTGKTALIMATQAKRVDNIKALLKLNADPNITDNKGMSAYDYAKKNGLSNLFP